MEKAVAPENEPSPEPQIQKSLQFAVRDGLFFSVMSGVGESYLGAFAIFLKASNPQIALLAALPQLVGAFFQFLSVRLLNYLKSRKKIILYGVIGQALAWLFILSTPLFSERRAVPWLIASVILYSVLGSFANPAWHSLMGDLVHSNRRGRYFGRRNGVMSIAAFASLCFAGLLLHRAESLGRVGFGFGLLFLIAFTARLISAYYLSCMSEPLYTPRAEDHFSVWQFLRDGRKTNFGRFVLFTALIHFSVHVSGPFISPYLLRDLNFSYLQFMCASAATVLAQFLTLHLWGRFGDQFGNKKVLTITGVLLPVLPLFWLSTTNFYLILAIQIFGGITWAGFSLSMGNFVFDAVSPAKRAQCSAIYNSANAVGIFLGALLGGNLSRWLPKQIDAGFLHLSLASNLQLLFLLSALLRFIVSMKYLPMIREVREVKPFGAKDFFVAMAQMRPVSGFKFNLFTLGRERASAVLKEIHRPKAKEKLPVTLGDRKE
ncbi:MAG: MFS transporter [Candidatus Manganitrophus sp. SA1]|nr:MFS transporter [Candidatus Manganitrophus morganii]